MNNQKSLPGPEDFFEIRFESIGGLGAHAAGQILAAAAILRMNMNGAHFSSYGSEKKGSVVRSFVRLGPSDKLIRTSAPIETPDVIVVFHKALLNHPGTLAGLKAKGTFIYNGAEGEMPEVLAGLPDTARVIRVDALQIAVDEKSRPNAVLLGTLSAAFPFLDFDILLEALSEEFAQRHPETVASNERAFRRGGAEFKELENLGKATGDLPIQRPGPVWGYETAPLGGVLPMAGNTVSNDLTASRMGWIPVLDQETCIHCGSCELVCPDLCLVWSADIGGSVRLKGIDYRYCKGCLRCVETCPTCAITRQPEKPDLADSLRLPLFEAATQ